ncbi:MAG: prolyl oligopeptidase family serine peptidase [Crocinitomix sp.]|nr:prolyl oligopeptidase family serine peptidase [Crocinitomix sp.]
MKNSIPIIALCTFMFACASNSETEEMNNNMPTPPIADKIEKLIITHGDTLKDNYFWMRLSDEEKEADVPDVNTQKVLDYLVAENTYLDEVMKHTEDLQTVLYDEIVGRIKQDDESVPVTKNGYSYYNRYEKGEDYALQCRKSVKEGVIGAEEIMLNGPEMGKDQSYFAIGGATVSEDNKLLAYSTDLVSRRQYTIHIKNLETGDLLSDVIENTSGGITWANDNKTIFYTKKDPVTLRANQIFSHTLGTSSDSDKLVFEEKDETFTCYVYKTKSRAYLMIGSSQTLSTEYRFLDANNPTGEWQVIQPRERDLEYRADHYQDDFYIMTNLEAKNFRLMKTPVNNTGKENWEEVIPHRSDVLLEGIDIFKNQLVVSERKAGLTQIRVMNWEGGEEHYLEFNDPAYSANTYGNPEFDTDILRFSYTSLTTPNSVYDYNMSDQTKELMKQQEVLGGKFDAANYTSERIFAEGRDGTQIPVSIVYKNGYKKDGNAPLLLYAYGSYGYSMDASFSSVRLSLLDRGFAFAIAHVRGGQEMGRQWYEDGKLLKKKNTFYDFIDCGKYLVENNYTSSEHLYAEGGSAGGLLMGGIANMEPELWNGIIAAVPFVDVINTMLDESIPLTTGEFDEWGNPKVKEYYDYIKSYSPYDNVEAKDYPNLLITTGYWDSQVQYWEPAKWIAKLRDLKTDDNKLLMRCNMEVGHGGASGRFERYKEVALEYAYLMDLEGIKE